MSHVWGSQGGSGVVLVCWKARENALSLSGSFTDMILRLSLIFSSSDGLGFLAYVDVSGDPFGFSNILTFTYRDFHLRSNYFLLFGFLFNSFFRWTTIANSYLVKQPLILSYLCSCACCACLKHVDYGPIKILLAIWAFELE